MPIYVIERKKDKVYHVIQGEALVYDLDAAANAGGGKKEKAEALKNKFEEVKNSPHTSYVAVQVNDTSQFLGGNTDQIP